MVHVQELSRHAQSTDRCAVRAMLAWSDKPSSRAAKEQNRQPLLRSECRAEQSKQQETMEAWANQQTVVFCTCEKNRPNNRNVHVSWAASRSRQPVALTHDAKGVHIPRLGEAAVPKSFWCSVHDGAHMVASWHMLLALQQGPAEACAHPRRVSDLNKSLVHVFQVKSACAKSAPGRAAVTGFAAFIERVTQNLYGQECSSGIQW